MANYMDLKINGGLLRLEPVQDNIIRCVFTKNEEVLEDSLMVQPKVKDLHTAFETKESETSVTLETAYIRAIVEKETGCITWENKKTGECFVKEAGRSLVSEDVVKYTTNGEEPVIDRVKTVDGERNFIRNLKPTVDRQAYRAKLFFDWQEDESIHGLGQGEEGIYNYRGHSQYLYQHNMRIPMPVFVSSKKYGIFFDCCSLMTFNDDENGSYLFMDTVDQMDYYFIGGENLDEIIKGYRTLTGDAVMLPKWAWGYVQSKEAYKTQQELVDVVEKYRELNVPLDCIVQDWNTWEPGKWGEKKVDKSRYPHLKEAMDKIHDMHVHTMVSVWPNMNPGVENHKEFFEAGYLLNDYSTYDAFNEEARKMYWKQAKEELFDGGFDSWWCDSTEPFSGPDWGGEVKREPWERYAMVGNEHKQYLDPSKANAFALMHAKGIFENQKKDKKDKRVLNLTRSGYGASQCYGTVLWSGDTCATWENFRKQIVEGLNFAMSGMPYWTLDIGAFFTVGSAWQNRGCGCNTNPNPLWFWQGAYNDGVKDPAYRELYVRWFEYGTFLPMFRSHGTDTPREIWNFGKKGEEHYDALEKFIKLRYQLMPYIYSLAGAVCFKQQTILRSLLFDFLEDETARAIKDEYMFGPSILVCPVTQPGVTTQKCYLPKGTRWIDFWSEKIYEGGQWIDAETPIDQIPLYIKAGSVIPMAEGLQYAAQPLEKPMEIMVYPGADAAFTLYEDAGDDYEYENGAYTNIPLSWSEQEKTLTIAKRQGSYPGMEQTRTFIVHVGGEEKTVNYSGEEVSVSFPR